MPAGLRASRESGRNAFEVTAFNLIGQCQPTTHRAVRSVSCPPPHHPQECRPEPPLSAQGWWRFCPRSTLRRHRSGVLNRARGRPPWHEFLPAICWILRGASSIGSPTPSAGGARKHGSPSAASSIRLRLGTQQCAVGPRRQKLRDALSEKATRCAVGPQPGCPLERSWHLGGLTEPVCVSI